MSAIPISSRKLSARILMLGWRSIEPADRARQEEHHEHRDDDRRDHDDDLVGHADGGDHRVEREDDVEQHDLEDHAPQRDRLRRELRSVTLLALEALVDLERRLCDEEEPAADEDDVASADLLAGDREQRRGQARRSRRSRAAGGCA